MTNQPTIEMSRSEEIELLTKHRKELASLSAQVADVFEFFKKNRLRMANEYSKHDRLYEISDKLHEESLNIQDEIDKLSGPADA